MNIRFFSAAAVLAFLILVANARAQLSINVTGVPGSGVTTWTFLTLAPGTASGAGTIRDNTANTFSAFDSGQFPFGQNTILDASFQDIVFTLTGTVMFTIGADTQFITGIYLDDDGASADDLGVRVGVPFDYLAGETSSWSGSGTVNVDITAFAPGAWSMNSTDGQAPFFANPVTVIFTAIPEPTSVGLLGIGALGLAVYLRRKKRS